MSVSELLQKSVCIETKSSGKYFGTLIEIDDSPKAFSWVIIRDKKGVIQTFADSEIVRLEVME